MDIQKIKLILQKLKTQKGASAFDFGGFMLSELDDSDSPWAFADRVPPTKHVYDGPINEIKKLVELELIDAYSSDETLLDANQISDDNIGDLTFYISPNTLGIEDLFGINLTNIPRFGAPNRSKNWPELFMLMPFAREMKPIFDDHIKKVASLLNITCGRADDFFTGKSIINDIWSAISHAKIIVADCTHRNPNVFYEIGIAHTLGKETILISQTIDDIPFDLRHWRILTYEYTPRGMNLMEQELEKAIRSLVS